MRTLLSLLLLTGMPVGLAAAQDLGADAPEINSPNFLGEKEHITLSTYEGKIVVLYFFRFEHDASEDTFSLMKRLARDFEPQGVVVLGCTPQDQKDYIDKQMKESTISFDLLYGGNLAAVYEVSSFPRVYIIDADRKIYWRGSPRDRVEEQLTRAVQAGHAGDNAQVLMGRLQRCAKAMQDGELAKAYTLAREVESTPKMPDEARTKIEELKSQIEGAAKDWIDEAKKAIQGENAAEGYEKLATLSVRFAGSDLGKKADEEIEAIKKANEDRTEISNALSEAKARMRLDLAAEQEASEQYLEAIQLYREIVSHFSKTEAATDAQAALTRIREDAGIQSALKQQQASEQANRWLELADRFAQVGMTDKAREYYQKILDEHGRSSAASKARERLSSLKEG